MRKQNTSKKLNCIRKMPPLYHTIPGEDFDIKKRSYKLAFKKTGSIKLSVGSY